MVYRCFLIVFKCLLEEVYLGVREQALPNFPVLNLGEKKKGKNNFFGAKVLVVIGKIFCLPQNQKVSG